MARARVALGDVHQDEAGVDQVEGAARRWAGRHVVLQDLDVGCGGAGAGGPREVDVGGEHVPGGADPLGQVVHHRGPARPHLPAAPARGQAQPVEMPEGGGIEQRGEGGEAVHRLGGVVGEEVALAVSSAPADGAG